jgi:hypothetical protein
LKAWVLGSRPLLERLGMLKTLRWTHARIKSTAFQTETLPAFPEPLAPVDNIALSG